MRAGLLGFLSGTVPQQPASNKENNTESTSGYKTDWLIRSGFLLTLITYINPLFSSMLATWAQYLSRCDSLNVASSVVCTGMAERELLLPEYSKSLCSTPTSCLAFPPILPAWPISVLLKYDWQNTDNSPTPDDSTARHRWGVPDKGRAILQNSKST